MVDNFNLFQFNRSGDEGRNHLFFFQIKIPNTPFDNFHVGKRRMDASRSHPLPVQNDRPAVTEAAKDANGDVLEHNREKLTV